MKKGMKWGQWLQSKHCFLLCFVMLAASRGKHNVMVWRPCVCLSVPSAYSPGWPCVSSCSCPCLNSLPSFVRDEQSLAAFRRQLKTVLFRTSFGEDANTWSVSLLTHDCSVFVRWPCNVWCVIIKFLSQVECGRPGGLLQSSSGGSNSIWFASASRSIWAISPNFAPTKFSTSYLWVPSYTCWLINGSKSGSVCGWYNFQITV